MANKRKTKAYRVRTYIYEHPDASASEVAKATKVSPAYVYNIMSSERKRVANKVAETEQVKPITMRKPAAKTIEIEQLPPLTWWQKFKLWLSNFGGPI